jgi:hypothetical protein
LRDSLHEKEKSRTAVDNKNIWFFEDPSSTAFSKEYYYCNFFVFLGPSGPFPVESEVFYSNTFICLCFYFYKQINNKG